VTVRRRRRKPRFERYDADQSPLAQKPTQRDLAQLLGLKKKSRLRAIVLQKDQYIIRRDIFTGRKLRKLAYPIGKLRRIHEILKFHCNKIKQPEYVYSPRKGRSQRDNALLHLGQRQFLKLDIKQFYPSTTSAHISRWACGRMGMFEDVARLLCDLCTVDGSISFGSPLTPVLATLVHREMFDSIAAECGRRGLRMSIWVDDIIISGRFVPGELVIKLRQIIQVYGLRSHRLEYKTGSRAVLITGIPIKAGRIHGPISLHRRIRDDSALLARAGNAEEKLAASAQLLSSLGSYRFIVGASSVVGRRAADRMAALRADRTKIGLSRNIDIRRAHRSMAPAWDGEPDLF
jgi:hypothetical protein